MDYKKQYLKYKKKYLAAKKLYGGADDTSASDENFKTNKNIGNPLEVLAETAVKLIPSSSAETPEDSPPEDSLPEDSPLKAEPESKK